MKALIPAAGAGRRLLPFTHTRPKPLIFVAGKPILAHILDSLVGVVDEVVIIVGYMKQMLIDYTEAHYGDRFRFSFVEQGRQLGLGHAILVGREAVGDSPLLITLGDEVFGISFGEMVKIHKGLGDCAASLAIKEVDNPRNYGVVELDGDRITRLVEKPRDPPANTAIAGVYIVNDTPALWTALEDLMRKAGVDPAGTGAGAPSAAGGNGPRPEVQLTDALQSMVESGLTLRTFPMEEWYDAGRPDMLLDVNEVLLNQLGSSVLSDAQNSAIIEPCSIGKGCRIVNSVVGPNVSIAEDSVLENCILRRTIVGSGSHLENVSLRDTIVGDHVRLKGSIRKMNIGDNTEIEL